MIHLQPISEQVCWKIDRCEAAAHGMINVKRRPTLARYAEVTGRITTRQLIYRRLDQAMKRLQAKREIEHQAGKTTHALVTAAEIEELQVIKTTWEKRIGTAEQHRQDRQRFEAEKTLKVPPTTRGPPYLRLSRKDHQERCLRWYYGRFPDRITWPFYTKAVGDRAQVWEQRLRTIMLMSTWTSCIKEELGELLDEYYPAVARGKQMMEAELQSEENTSQETEANEAESSQGMEADVTPPEPTS